MIRKEIRQRKRRKKRRHEYDILENEGKREDMNMIY